VRKLRLRQEGFRGFIRYPPFTANFPKTQIGPALVRIFLQEKQFSLLGNIHFFSDGLIRATAFAPGWRLAGRGSATFDKSTVAFAT